MDFDFDEEYEGFGCESTGCSQLQVGETLDQLLPAAAPAGHEASPKASPLRSLREERFLRQLDRQAPGACSPLPAVPALPSSSPGQALATPTRGSALSSEAHYSNLLQPAQESGAASVVATVPNDAPVSGVYLPELPNEDAFVAARPSVRQQEYQRLEMWLSRGGSAEQFIPWFREMLMDVDGQALVAACQAVAAHYRHIAKLQAAGIIVEPASLEWLAAFGERLLSAGPAEKSAAGALAAAVVTAASKERSGFWSEVDVLLQAGSAVAAAGAVQLVVACAEQGSISKQDLQVLTKTIAGAAPGLLAGNDGSVVRGPLASFISVVHPSLRSALPSSLTRLLDGPPAVASGPIARGLDAGFSSPAPSKGSSPHTMRGVALGSPGTTAPSTGLASALTMTPPGTSGDPTRVLNDSSPKSWRQRLACLESIQGPDADGFHGPILWPQLVLQAEDDHPAVAAAALRAVARLAPSFAGQKTGHPGDHLVARLAAAVRVRLREGRSRGVEAAHSCIASLACSPAVLGGQGLLSSFLSQALGCSKERARAAVSELLAEGAGKHWSPGGQTQETQSPPMMKSGTCKAASGVKNCLQWCQQLPPVLEGLLLEASTPKRPGWKSSPSGNGLQTPTPSPGPVRRASSAGAVASPLRTHGFSGLATSLLSPVERATPSAMLPQAPFSPDVPFSPDDTSLPEISRPRGSPSQFASPCFPEKVSPIPEEQTPLCKISIRAPAAASSTKPSRYASLAGTPPLASRSPPATAPHSLLQLPPSACTPPRRCPSSELFGLSSTPEPRPSGVDEHPTALEGLAARALRAWGQEHVQSREKQAADAPGSVPASWGGLPASAGSSFAGPQLQADSKLLGLSQVLRSTGHSTAGLCATRSQDAPLEAAAPAKAPGATQLCEDLEAGLGALTIGQGPEQWHAALQAVARWDGGEVQQGAGQQPWAPVVQMILTAGAQLPPAAQPELWRALTELSHAPWLPEAAFLELAVKQCLAFMDPQVVSAFLAEQVAVGRVSAQGALEFCLARLLNISKGRGGLGKLTRLILCFVQVLSPKTPSVLGDLCLPSLPAVVEWAVASQSQHSALPPLRSALELLLQHLAPESVSERCWAQLLKLLGEKLPKPPQITSPAATTSVGAGRAKQAWAMQSLADAQAQDAKADSASFAGCDEEDTLAEDEKLADPGPALLEHGTGPPEVVAGDGPCSSISEGFGSDYAELSATLGKLHKITLELSRRAEASDEVVGPLQLATQLLSRPQSIPPLRAFLRRLLGRQRLRTVASKENLPPPSASAPGLLGGSKVSPGGAGGGQFISDDYASVRELSSDEGLAGAFPHSLLAHLKRLLRAPAAASTHRAAADCLSAMALACGPLLLKVLLGHFAVALLRLAASRGPAQGAARSALTQLVALDDSSVTPTGRPSSPQSWLRLVWRALMQAVSVASSTGNSASRVSSSPSGPSPGGSGEQASAILVEALRWLAEEALPLLQQHQPPGFAAVSAQEVRELLPVLASSLLERSQPLRGAAGRCLLVLAAARGSTSQLREEVLAQPLVAAAKSAALSLLERGSVQGGRAPISPALAGHAGSQSAQPRRSPPGSAPPLSSSSGQASSSGQSRSAASGPRRLQFSPSADDCRSPPWGGSNSRASGRRNSGGPDQLRRGLEMAPTEPMPLGVLVQGNEQWPPPASCQAPLAGSPVPSSWQDSSTLQAAHSADACSAVEIEAELMAWSDELSRNVDVNRPEQRPDWPARTALLRSRLEALSMRGGAPGSADGMATLIHPMFLLCGRLAAQAGVEEDGNLAPELLRAMGVAVSAAGDAFPAAVLQHMGTPAPAAAVFRAALETLEQLQNLSRSGDERVRRAAAPVLMELPPLLARVVDAVEAPGQLVAWLRVASELLMDARAAEASREKSAPEQPAEDAEATRRWALRFCTRCVERCLANLGSGGHEERCAWEVLSEITKFYSWRDSAEPGKPQDAALAADCKDWVRTLEGAASAISRQYPAQAREFQLLANCTGSPLPAALGHFD